MSTTTSPMYFSLLSMVSILRLHQRSLPVGDLMPRASSSFSILTTLYPFKYRSKKRRTFSASSGTIIQPELQPRFHGVLLRFQNIQPGGLLDRRRELLFDLRLRFAQHVFEDLFPGHRIMPDGVTPFPASVRSFSDIALAVSASFCHVESPLFKQHTIPHSFQNIQSFSIKKREKKLILTDFMINVVRVSFFRWPLFLCLRAVSPRAEKGVP